MSERAQRLLEIADDELILGWRDSEWTGIAPFLEEDVAFSSIAQNEIGHARALYELAAASSGRPPTSSPSTARRDEYRCAPLVELRLVPDWARTIARHFLYEEADGVRIEALKASDDAEVAGLAAKIDREEAYHRMHAEMWIERCSAEERRGSRRSRSLAYALGVLDASRGVACERALPSSCRSRAGQRGAHRELQLWEEMTMVRRSRPGATW